jgi:hypothetical protein
MCAVIAYVIRTVLVDELQGLFDFLQPASGDHHPLHPCFPGSPKHLCHRTAPTLRDAAKGAELLWGRRRTASKSSGWYCLPL